MYIYQIAIWLLLSYLTEILSYIVFEILMVKEITNKLFTKNKDANKYIKGDYSPIVVTIVKA